MARNLVLVIVWVAISGTLSSSWSSSINSLFTARNAKYGEIGGNKILMESVGNGAQMALEHCQENFKWDRWNCPETVFSRRTTHLLTRETTFTHALKSAGIVHSITRNCSRGELPNCGCDASYSGGGGYTTTSNNISTDTSNTDTGTGELGHWTWGGCSDSLEYGEHVAKMVLEDHGRDWKAVVERHNYAAGRMVIRATMKKHCRCHGVSGSCSLQTCWMQMAPFHEITNELRTKYEKAQKVDHGQKFNSVGDFNVIADVPSEDLIYLNDSPNYCKLDLNTGWNGTKGRSCSRNKGDSITLAERKSCKNLCRTCGHRVRRERRSLTRRCNCTFHWCCEVKCDTCTDIVNEFFCE